MSKRTWPKGFTPQLLAPIREFEQLAENIKSSSDPKLARIGRRLWRGLDEILAACVEFEEHMERLPVEQEEDISSLSNSELFRKIRKKYR